MREVLHPLSSSDPVALASSDTALEEATAGSIQSSDAPNHHTNHISTSLPRRESADQNSEETEEEEAEDEEEEIPHASSSTRNVDVITPHPHHHTTTSQPKLALQKNPRERNPDSTTLEGGSLGPVSRYYNGPPSKSAAFGSEPIGIIGKHLPREIIRIERDYSLAPSHIPQFHPTFPLELEGRINPTQFSELINDINELLVQANDPWWAALDNGLAVTTLWISPWILGSRYQRKSKQLIRLLEKQNKLLLNPNGLHLLHPRSNAWLYLEMEYY